MRNDYKLSDFTSKAADLKNAAKTELFSDIYGSLDRLQTETASSIGMKNVDVNFVQSPEQTSVFRWHGFPFLYDYIPFKVFLTASRVTQEGSAYEEKPIMTIFMILGPILINGKYYGRTMETPGEDMRGKIGRHTNDRKY